jgi:voltage-gated sodium channel
MQAIASLLAHKTFQKFIIGVILLNAAILGLLTMPGLDSATAHALHWLDQACLVVFCIEIALKLTVQRARFFRDGWNVFDFVVVAIALAPATGPLSVLRALRTFRLMRLVTSFPSMRQVIAGMFGSIPGVASVAGILFVIFYVFAIMAIGFFGHTDPENFGSLGTTFFTLFQLMTTEGWPTMARTLMETSPLSWIFFVTFILLTTFTTLNLVFGIVVNSMEEAKEEAARESMEAQGVSPSHQSAEVRLAIIENTVKSTAADLEALQNAIELLIHSRTSQKPPISSKD